MTRYMVGMHDDPAAALDEDVAHVSTETILEDIARYCELQLENVRVESEL